MKTNPSSILARICLPTLCATRLLSLVGLLLLLLPAAVQAQFNYGTNDDGTVTITGYTGPGGVVTIPDAINGLPVSSIGGQAFQDCTSLTNVTIPNSVTSIGWCAFAWCTSLTSVTIGNSVTNIGDNAFCDCTSLTSVTIPNSVTNIGIWAFENCTSLTSATIGNSVTSIGYWAFGWCASLTNVMIGNSVTNIGASAFSGCTSLTSVTIPNSVTRIGGHAFWNCTNLTSAYFQGNAPADLGDLAFYTYNTETEDWEPLNATVYYLPGTTGWGATYGGLPTAPWLPQVRTADVNFGVRTNGFGFNLTWVSDQVVVVEASPSLTNPTWTPVATNKLTGGLSYFSDPQWTNHPARFYRLRSP